MKVNLSSPDISEADIQAVVDVLRTPNLSLGPKLGEFEQAFVDYIGKKRAVAVNSGTSGLYLAMLAMGIGAGDEVITTPFTFIASVTSIMMTGATPVLADIDPVTLNLDPAKLEAKITDKTKAILPVEVFGSTAHFDKYVQIAEKHNLLIIEDCCEALGSKLNGQKAGTFGDVSMFAFYPNKQMTTGEGGMIMTDDDTIADLCVSLRNQGRGTGGGWLAHERLGFNYRLSDINCALGISQLKRIEEFKNKRAQVAKLYQQYLEDEQRIIVPQVYEGCDMSWFVFVICLKEQYSFDQRNQLLSDMIDQGIGVSNYFPPVHLQPFIQNTIGTKLGDFPVTENVSEHTMAIPFHNNLPESDVKLVCDTLKNCLDKI